MKWQVNLENDNVNTQTSDNKQIWRKSRKHIQQKPGGNTQQLMIISTLSIQQIPSVSTTHSLNVWPAQQTEPHLGEDEKTIRARSIPNKSTNTY